MAIESIICLRSVRRAREMTNIASAIPSVFEWGCLSVGRTRESCCLKRESSSNSCWGGG